LHLFLFVGFLDDGPPKKKNKNTAKYKQDDPGSRGALAQENSQHNLASTATKGDAHRAWQDTPGSCWLR
jgi:hypothetical protein